MNMFSLFFNGLSIKFSISVQQCHLCLEIFRDSVPLDSIWKQVDHIINMLIVVEMFGKVWKGTIAINMSIDINIACCKELWLETKKV